MRKRPLVVLIAITLVVMVAPVLLSFVGSNAGFLSLNRQTAAAQPISADLLNDVFLSAAALYPGNRASHRGLGHVNLALGRLNAAQSEFAAGGLTAEDILFFADMANRENDLRAASAWLQVAELMEPENGKLWHVSGKVCQKNPGVGALCARFLTENEGNWLVNDDFAFGTDGWQPRIEEGFDLHYEIESCPDDGSGLCATMRSGPMAPEHGLSLSQCITLEPGQAYQFSAWIKSAVDENGEWRPAYIQGEMAGEARGIWPGTQYGPSGWTYWEQTFTMPEFDDDQACFYPVRLLDSGQIWFSQPLLRILD